MKEFKKNLAKAFGKKNLSESFDELTLIINSDDVIEVCTQLRDDFNFDILIDLCGIDYLTYGESDWNGNASSSGFGRARQVQKSENKKDNRSLDAPKEGEEETTAKKTGTSEESKKKKTAQGAGRKRKNRSTRR